MQDVLCHQQVALHAWHLIDTIWLTLSGALGSGNCCSTRLIVSRSLVEAVSMSMWCTRTPKWGLAEQDPVVTRLAGLEHSFEPLIWGTICEPVLTGLGWASRPLANGCPF